MKYFFLKRLLSILYFLLIANIATAQEKFIISGKIVDQEGCPMEGAMIVREAIIDTIKTKKGKRENTKPIFADKDGYFKLETDKPFSYFQVTTLGMKPRNGILAKKDSIYNIIMEEAKMTEIVITKHPNKKERRKRGDGPITIGKPVIYLYPIQETDVELKVNFEGKFMFTFPEYLNGWKVTAQPDGKLMNKSDKSEHHYLFWEGAKYPTLKDEDFKKGYVVEGNKVTDFLKTMLPKLGLQPKEYNDFIVYWAPKMVENKWNWIHFLSGEEYNSISTNSVAPKPDTNIRVFMYFRALEQEVEVTPQNIITPERKGFTLVEWGGAEL